MSVPKDKAKSPPPLPPLPPRALPPRPNPNAVKPYNFDKTDGIGKDLVQRMREKAVVTAVIFSSAGAPGKRNSKLIISTEKTASATPTPAPTPRNSGVMSAPLLQQNVSFAGDEAKIVFDTTSAIGCLKRVKALSVALTPALKRQQRGRTKTTDDVRESKPARRRGTPHPRASGD